MEITYGEPHREFAGMRIDVFLHGELQGYLYRHRPQGGAFAGWVPPHLQRWRYHNTDHHAESDFFARFEDAHPWIVEHLNAGGR